MLALVFAVLVGGAFQNPPPPPPPPPPPMRAPRDLTPDPKGTAVIKGHAVTMDGRPLRRVQIRVSGGPLREGATATTGLEGEYEVPELPAGRYTIQATRSGYLPTSYGQRAYGEAGTPVEIASGATVDTINFVLSRAGVVSGRVTDETGDPVAGVDIRAMQWQFYRGRKRIVPVATSMLHVTTDDTGLYRLTGLPPGDYFVTGRLRESWMSDDKEPQMLSYAPTYYPGVADAAEARRVKIASGQEAPAIDFALVAVRAARVSGTALSAEGTPLAGARLMLTQEIMGPGGGSMFFAGSTQADDAGLWTLTDVAPGDYVLRANGRVGDGPNESATLPLTVHGADITGLIVAADAGGLVSGRVVTAAGEAPPSSLGRLTVTTTPVSMETGIARPSPGVDDGVVGPDGGYVRKSMSGPVVLRVVGLPRAWAVTRIDAGGRDLAGLPIEIRPGQPVANVTIVISDGLKAVTGKVADAEGRAADATVLLFPSDPVRWIEAAGNQRTARTDASGTYRFDAVRSGEYFVIAVDSMQQWQMNDPEFLTEQQKRAIRVTVGDTELPPLNLKVVR
jgi:hypothetical protein